ncbi:MAG: hypothetical protein IJE97_12530 [Thermoguttaceae bacterium]|nr:hypothetical protein [Thermoguttaceae bacterium]
MTFFLFLSSCAARYVSTRNGGFGRFERRVDGYYFRTRRENQDVRRLDGALFAKFRRAAPDFAARTPISPPAERPPNARRRFVFVGVDVGKLSAPPAPRSTRTDVSSSNRAAFFYIHQRSTPLPPTVRRLGRRAFVERPAIKKKTNATQSTQ